MKKNITFLLLCALLISACSSASPSADAVQSTSAPLGNNQVNPQSTADSSVNQQAPARRAAITEIQNDVQVILNAGENPTTAEIGLFVPVGGTVQTGNDSRARLDLLPEGTIVRVGSNSTFIVTSVEIVDGKPKTTLSLLAGKIWVLLAGGELAVETESGVASVRGSLLSVEYDPETDEFNVSCLEGHCGVSDGDDEDGDGVEDEVDLTEGEYVSVGDDGDYSEVEDIPEDELEEWVNENPEYDEFFDGEVPDWVPEPDDDYEPFDGWTDPDEFIYPDELYDPEYYYDPYATEEPYITEEPYATEEPYTTEEPAPTDEPEPEATP